MPYYEIITLYKGYGVNDNKVELKIQGIGDEGFISDELYYEIKKKVMCAIDPKYCPER